VRLVFAAGAGNETYQSADQSTHSKLQTRSAGAARRQGRHGKQSPQPGAPPRGRSVLSASSYFSPGSTPIRLMPGTDRSITIGLGEWAEPTLPTRSVASTRTRKLAGALVGMFQT